jgi:hypothetical protein
LGPSPLPALFKGSAQELSAHVDAKIGIIL